MDDIPIIKVVCHRCGYINEFEIPLVAKDTDAVLRCERCTFVIVVVFWSSPS